MAGYRVNRQQPGTRVSFWPDPRGQDHGDLWVGTIIDHMGDTISLVWDHDDEYFEVWMSPEVRYRIDRGQMRLTPPPKKRRLRIPESELICKVCSKPRALKCGHKSPGALKPEEWGTKSVPALLTDETPYDMMESSIGGNPPTRKGAMMARKKAEVVDEIDDEPAEATPEANGEGEMLTAKAAASLLKTDGRTLRKFLRKKHGTVGQGQRWAIDASEIDDLRSEFQAWAKGGKSTNGEKASKKVEVAEEVDEEPLADAELEEIDEIEDLDFGDDED